MQNAGRFLIILGVLTLLIGVVLYMGWGRTAFGWMGRLPGDIRIEGQNASFYFPIVTSIVLSIVLTIVIRLIMWIRGV
jgi:hypothetical protein